ncbi:hypothetical protein KL86DYS2_13140 [uncultured Dysgonomonas sp.]|uniref:Uncharacterized protein n=1 Tax=uncultured Dysgonomonas sp. TaxID=206096 RepID=A0A212K714_9BACT|nr:hypothetical protein KL86DYS2_13140 [uncultured Dysgonomonas sp.]
MITIHELREIKKDKIKVRVNIFFIFVIYKAIRYKFKKFSKGIK